MEKQNSRPTILLAILLLPLMLLLLLVAGVYFAASVSGTATLPGGLVARIDGPFSVSENAGRTTVEASGRRFVFTPTAITVDGTRVATLDTSVLQVAIDARGYDAELLLNGKFVLLPSR